VPNKPPDRLFLRLLAYLKPHAGMIGLTWCLSICILLAQAAAIWVGSEFIEKLLSGKYQGGNSFGAFYFDKLASYLLLRDDEFESLILAMIFVAGCGISISVMRVIKMFLLAKINQDELLTIRNQLFRKLTRLNILFSRRYRHGETASVFINDVNQLNYAFVDLIDRIFMQPLRLLFGLALMFTISLKITAITLLCLLPSSVLIHVSGVHIQRLVTQVLEKVAALQGRLSEYLAIVTLSRALGSERRESEDFHDEASQLCFAQRRLMLMDAAAPQIAKIVGIGAASVLTLVGGYEVLVEKSMQGGDLIKLALLLPMVTYPVEALASLYVSLRTSFASAKRIFALMDESAYDDSLSGTISKSGFDSSVEFRSVNFALDGKAILSDISLRLDKGRCYLIFGPSGAGKSTLLALLAKFATPQSGAILVDDVDLAAIDSDDWRRCLGIVAQESILINASVRQNLQYAKPDADDTELVKVLRTVRLDRLDESTGRLLERQVGNRGDFLSGGERQRFSIARALLNAPDLLLIDEPTANLDSDNSKAIIDLLNTIKPDRTMIIVSHDTALRTVADIEIRLEAGGIAEIIDHRSSRP
jgi:ATP-binding cassette, subfamily B, bacterial MsbA